MVGRGSAAFETIVALVDLLPVMPVPQRASTPTQPIALTDMVRYLTGVAGRPRRWAKASTSAARRSSPIEMIQQIARLRAMLR